MEEKEKLKPVVKGKVDEKPSALDKAIHGFISADSGKIGDYLLNDIIMPSIKDMISKAVKGGIDTLLFGVGQTNPNQKKGPTSSISYRSFYDQPAPGTLARSHAVYEYRDLSFRSKAEAESVIQSLLDVLDQYGKVNVGQLFELAQVTPSPTDYNYGWYDLKGVNSYRCLNGEYKIELPQAVVLK